MKIHEMFGILAEQQQQEAEGFARTLQLLRDLQAGKVSLEDVRVGETGWDIPPKEA